MAGGGNGQRQMKNQTFSADEVAEIKNAHTNTASEASRHSKDRGSRGAIVENLDSNAMISLTDKVIAECEKLMPMIEAVLTAEELSAINRDQRYDLARRAINELQIREMSGG